MARDEDRKEVGSRRRRASRMKIRRKDGSERSRVVGQSEMVAAFVGQSEMVTAFVMEIGDLLGGLSGAR